MIGAIVDELAPEPRRPQLDRPHRRCAAAAHGRRQSRTVAIRGQLRSAVRRQSGPGLIRKDHPASAQPRRRSRRQQRATHHRHRTLTNRSREPRPTSPGASPKGIPSSTPFEPSSATSRERSSRSSRSVARRSTRPESPLDKQKGVQGSQFTSFAFTDLAEDAGIRICMDGAGAGWTTSSSSGCGEALKYECVFLNAFETGSEARTGIGRWIGYYNAARPHSSFGGRTPDEVYAIELKRRNWRRNQTRNPP